MNKSRYIKQHRKRRRTIKSRRRKRISGGADMATSLSIGSEGSYQLFRIYNQDFQDYTKYEGEIQKLIDDGCNFILDTDIYQILQGRDITILSTKSEYNSTGEIIKENMVFFLYVNTRQGKEIIGFISCKVFPKERVCVVKWECCYGKDIPVREDIRAGNRASDVMQALLIVYMSNNYRVKQIYKQPYLYDPADISEYISTKMEETITDKEYFDYLIELRKKMRSVNKNGKKFMPIVPRYGILAYHLRTAYQYHANGDPNIIQQYDMHKLYNCYSVLDVSHIENPSTIGDSHYSIDDLNNMLLIADGIGEMIGGKPRINYESTSYNYEDSVEYMKSLYGQVYEARQMPELTTP